MRFVERITSLKNRGDHATAVMDGKHTLRVEALTDSLLRVLVKKNGRCRLNRTWSIARGEAEVPWEGWKRECLPGGRAAFELSEDSFQTGDLEIRFASEPYCWELLHQGRSVLKERTTGALAFGRKDNRLWHFLQLKEHSRFYGLGERTGEMDRRGRSFELRNVDPMGYDARTSDPLYKHIPFYIEQHSHGFVGVFYDNYANARLNFGEEIDNYHGPFTSYRAEDGDFDLYLLVAPTLLEVTSTFSRLTGRTYLPPRWSLGYSTTSMHYTDHPRAQERLEKFLRESREHDIPVKSFKYGSGYTSREGKRYVFTWNEEKFPAPKELNRKFHQRGIRLAANIKPVLLKDHPCYEEIAPLAVRDSEDEAPEVSQFWDNRGTHLDFTNPATREWWGKKVGEKLLDFGFHALWNDNNEYVIWDDEARCHGFGEEIPISLIRPLMSLWMTRTSHQAAQARQPGKRIWSISRCGCPGLQRYAQTWSGDNRTAWETLEYNQKMALGLSLSGIYNIGHDTGGFSGPAPGPELLARWFWCGVTTPRFGVNSWKPDGTITEPWMYPEVLPHIRAALAWRMRFLPHLYSLMKEAHLTYRPVLRPSFANFEDGNEELMWGGNLLPAPVFQEGARTRKVYLPSTEHGWWSLKGEFFQGGEEVEVEAPLSEMPVFVRGGSALFLGKPGADTVDGPESEREIHLFPGGDFQAEFWDDDGETLEGPELHLRLEVAQTDGQLSVKMVTSGDYRPPYERIRFVAPPGYQVVPEQVYVTSSR